jgi:hypothetical protein
MRPALVSMLAGIERRLPEWSKVENHIDPERQCVWDGLAAAWVDEVLKVRLHQQARSDPASIRPLQRHFPALDADGGVGQDLNLLRAAQVAGGSTCAGGLVSDWAVAGWARTTGQRRATEPLEEFQRRDAYFREKGVDVTGNKEPDLHRYVPPIMSVAAKNQAIFSA